MSSSGGSSASSSGGTVGSAGVASLGNTNGSTGGGTSAAGGAGGASGLGLGARGGQSTGGSVGASGGQGTGATGGSVASAAGGGAGMPSSAGMSSGGSTSDVVTDLPPATWDTLKLVLTGTNPPCNSSTCHGSAGGKGGFGFPVKNDAQLFTQLTTHVVKECGNVPIVTPGDPSKSALLMVLRGPCSADVERMPRGCTDDQGNCVPPEYIAALEQWIADGAVHP